jgi:hypothetical protein
VGFGLPKGRPLTKDDGPRHQREREQNQQDGERHRSRIQDQLERIQGRGSLDDRRADLLQVLGFHLGAETFCASNTRYCESEISYHKGLGESTNLLE